MVPNSSFPVAPRKRGPRAANAVPAHPPVQATGKLWVPAFAGMTIIACRYHLLKSDHWSGTFSAVFLRIMSVTSPGYLRSLGRGFSGDSGLATGGVPAGV